MISSSVENFNEFTINPPWTKCRPLESFNQGINVFTIVHFPQTDVRVQVLVNDTVIGEALCTVPILVSEEKLQNLHVDKRSLCCKIHCDSVQWFYLLTDDCGSVNSHYVALSERVNVMNSIGVRPVDNDKQCVNIGMEVNECAATVNGVNRNSMGRYSAAGMNIRRYRNRSVTNCAELTLVMWVICERRTFDDPGQLGMDITAGIIKL